MEEEINMKRQTVPLWKKACLTLEESSQYFGIGINKIRELTNGDDCEFVLWVGTKRLIKREAFEKYLNRCFSI